MITLVGRARANGKGTVFAQNLSKNFSLTNCAVVAILLLLQQSTMSIDFPEAKLSKNGNVKAISGERELKRCPRAHFGDTFVSMTLTNHRILIAAREEKVTRELKLSDIVKAKAATGGMFKSGKKAPEMTIKMNDETKHKFTFEQLIVSIYSPVEERDDFLQLLNDNLPDKVIPANLNQVSPEK
jgi:hypothetical protein